MLAISLASNWNVQLRLVIELRLAGITDIESANQFLVSYVKEFNALFSLPLNHTKSVFENQPSREKINHTLAVLSTRKLDAGHCIRYKNKYFIPVTRSGTKAFLKKGMTVMVFESFDGSLYANILDQLFALEEITVREAIS